MKTAEVPFQCGPNTSYNLTVFATFARAPEGWSGDMFSPTNRTDWEQTDTSYHGPGFLPSNNFNKSVANGSVFPSQLPTFFGCACNCSYVSFACCDARDGMVQESAENYLGRLENCKTSNVLVVSGNTTALSASAPVGGKSVSMTS